MANRYDLSQYDDAPSRERFLKRKYKNTRKSRKKSLRDHRRACMKGT